MLFADEHLLKTVAFSQLPVEDDIDLSDVDLDDIWDKDELWDLRKLLFLGEFAQQFATWFTFRWIFQWPFYGEIARDTLCYLMHCSSELYATQENIAEILWIVITSKLDCILCNKYFEDNIDFFFFFFETSWVWFCWQCAVWVLQKALSVTNFKCVFFSFLWRWNLVSFCFD